MQHNESWIRLRNLAISLAVFVALALFATTYSEPVLRVSLMPDAPPPVMRHELKPLIDYPEKKIGMKIEFRSALDGDTLVDALIGKKTNLAWLDGFYFIRAKTRSNGQVIPPLRSIPYALDAPVACTMHHAPVPQPFMTENAENIIGTG